MGLFIVQTVECSFTWFGYEKHIYLFNYLRCFHKAHNLYKRHISNSQNLYCVMCCQSSIWTDHGKSPLITTDPNTVQN